MLNKLKKNISEFGLLKKQEGFSILEVMVAIVIFSIGLIGISSLMLQSMQAESLNAGYLKASFLAQEGIELVRNVRDENWVDLSATTWDRGIGDGGDNTFVVDYTVGSIDFGVDSIDEPGAILYLNANNFYTHESSGNTPTTYRRLITISSTCGSNCWGVKAEVSWRSSGKINDYIAETILYDWR